MSQIPDDILAKARKALDKAKIELMSSPNSAFISTVCFSMKCLWRDDLPTAATDGRAIWFNPYSYLALSPGKQLSRLLHETWHPALLHLDRVGSRDPKIWNMACDYFINLMLTDAGYEKIETWLWEPDFRGMSADAIYQHLIDNQPEGGFPDFDDQDLEPPKDEPERIELQCHMDQVLIRAVMHSKMAGDKPGSIPGEVETYLDKLMNPILPWYRILLKHMHGLNKSSYTWKKPNRRFFPDHHLPSMKGHALDEIASFVDISGSVSDQDFCQTVSEVHQVIKQFRPRLLHFGQFDTTIKSVKPIKTVKQLIETEFHGRGGTLIKPVIDWIAENKPKLTLIFTDGGFREYNVDPGTPVIWLIHNNPTWTAPFGKVIHYSM